MNVESLMVYPEALAPETLVSGWRILSRSGKGGFGAVYRVEDAARPGEVYALKMALRLGDPRAEREATLLMAKAGHPNLVRIHGCGRWPHPKEGYRYIVMDYVEGPNLIDWVEGVNPTFHQLGAVLDKLTQAVGFLHDHDAWHRDIKPENILVRSRDGEPVLLDLGVGDFKGADTLTHEPLPPGTPHCRSPEALRFNQRNWGREDAHYEYKATDDLYALGVTAYRVLTGHWPFPPGLPRELLDDIILWRVPPSPLRVNPRVPAGLAAIVMRLLDKNPEARFQNTRELHEALVVASAFGKPLEWEANCFEWEAELEGACRRILRPAPPRLPPPIKLPEPPRPISFAPAGAHVPPVPEHEPAQEALPGAPGLLPAVPRGDESPVALDRSLNPSWKRRAQLIGLGLLFMAGVFLVVRLYPTLRVGSASHTQATHEVAKEADSSEAERTAEVDPAVVAAPATRPEEPTPVMTKKAPSQKPATQRKSHPLKKGAVAAACLQLGTACAGTQVKPFEEEKCPPKTLAIMTSLGLEPGDSGSLIIDIHQPGLQADGGLYKDGPVTSVLRGVESQTLPEGTLFFGTLWTYSGRKSSSGLDKMYGRYTEILTPDGHRYPICAILGDQEGVPQEETSKPGAVVLPRALPFRIVDRYVFD